MIARERIAERLAQAGFDAADVTARLALFDRAIAAFVKTTNRPPSWGWFVPGRIEIFGKHTDYAGGRSLVAAVPRGFALVAGSRADGVVSAHDARWDVAMDVRPPDDGRSFKGWANYVAVVARRFAHNFPGAPLGADLVFASDLPRAAGLSSSSALVVGVGTALARRAALHERPEWRAALPTTLEWAGYLGAAENGLAFSGLETTGGVGTHGGSEDHTAILASRANHVRAFAYVPVRLVGEESMPEGWRFVVMASGIEADKAGSARLKYNRASLATRALVELWQRAMGGPSETLAAIAGKPAAADELKALVARAGPGEFSAGNSSGGSSTSSGRMAASRARSKPFGRADAGALGDLSADSQGEADALLGNQIPETNTLARLAREHGAFAATQLRRGVWRQRLGARAGRRGRGIRGAMAIGLPRGRSHGRRCRWFRRAARAGGGGTRLQRIVIVPCRLVEPGISWSWNPQTRATIRFPVSRLWPDARKPTWFTSGQSM